MGNDDVEKVTDFNDKNPSGSFLLYIPWSLSNSCEQSLCFDYTVILA